MDTALPIQSTCVEGAVDAAGTRHGQPIKDQEHCAVDAPLPLYDDGDDDGDADKHARRTTTCARAFLALGLALEVSATLWAFQKADSAGALDETADCTSSSRIIMRYSSSIVVDKCPERIDADAFYNFTDSWNANPYGQTGAESSWEEYVVCDDLTYAPTEHSFRELCLCDPGLYAHEFSPCSWVAIFSPSNDICYAQSVLTDTSNGTTPVRDLFHLDSCENFNPTGTAPLTIAAFVVALSSQLLEAVVGFKYWKGTEQTTAPTLAASIFEALGVLAVSSVLLSLPNFDKFPAHKKWVAITFFSSAWTVVALVIVGALAEIMAECTDCAARRLPYLGAVGNGLIWLGAALIEVVVTLYLLHTGTGIEDFASVASEVGGLFAVELLGLVAMWIARAMWTKAKLSRRVKRLQEAVRKGAIVTRTHFT